MLKGRISETILRGEITRDHLPELRALISAEEVKTAPVSRKGMVALLEALFQHYYAVSLEPSAQQQRWRDWHEDVGHLPTSALAEACAKWRRSAAKHAPSPGQLLALVPKDYRARWLAAKHAVDLLVNVDKGVDRD